MSEKHHHEGGHKPHLEKRRTATETRALEARVRKLEEALTSWVVVAKEALDRVVEIYENDLGPLNGAKVVARAWVDEAYRQRLLEDATKAIRELGFGGLQGEHMVVVEHTLTVHNVVSCTLCSCYPWPVLGLPPTWYKEAPYRSRIAIDPRGVLREFGIELEAGGEVRVWDSSAELRYLVLPERPEGTENFDEESLVKLVTRDSMIGVCKASEP